jgi:hypothetical protein
MELIRTATDRLPRLVKVERAAPQPSQNPTEPPHTLYGQERRGTRSTPRSARDPLHCVLLNKAYRDARTPTDIITHAMCGKESRAAMGNGRCSTAVDRHAHITMPQYTEKTPHRPRSSGRAHAQAPTESCRGASRRHRCHARAGCVVVRPWPRPELCQRQWPWPARVHGARLAWRPTHHGGRHTLEAGTPRG